VFLATIDGPADALFVVEVNQKGEPVYGFRADSVIGAEDLPRELGGVVDTGRMTTGIGVVEDGKFVNADSGAVTLGAGLHHIKIYAPNTNLQVAGDFVRLYVRAPDGPLVASPVAPY
jgi:Ethanolamine utilization protein EutJ (predicted chaperonin)